MPNPVAEVVERLRARHDEIVEYCKRVPASTTTERAPEHVALYRNAADLIERLSRERDTGVPEVQTALDESEARLLRALQRNLALRVAMQRAAKIIKTNLYHQREKVADAETILLEALENSEPDAAAPQPPTVSPDLSTLTRERDQAREALAEIACQRALRRRPMLG